jgi:hypothetical protein
MNTNNKQFYDAVNQYGGPFKKGVMKALMAYDGISIIAEEYPAGLGDERTAIDIVASLEHSSCICYLTIECKRALAAYKKWVFFKETATRTYKLGRWVSKTTSLSVASHRNWLPDIEFCSDGCEVKEEHNQKEIKLKSSTEPIHKAATQAALGYLSFLQERTPSAPLTDDALIPHRHLVVLPLIITSAELLISNEDGSNVDLRTGLCAMKEPTPTPWLAYRFPCHPTTSDRNEDRRLISPTESYISACMGTDSSTADTYKETIYIVQAQHIDAFIKKPLFTVLNHIVKLVPGPQQGNDSIRPQ